jgi:hypothetical protein
MENEDKNKRDLYRISENDLMPDDFGDSLSKRHKDHLGLEVPDDFFQASKLTIMKEVSGKNQPKGKVFGLRSMMAYPIAASILILVAISLWLPNNKVDPGPKVSDPQMNTDQHALNRDDFLLNSLLVDDKDIHIYVEDYVLNNIVVEAELSEQQLENIFLNSLFVEDSLIDGYIDSSLVENIIL